MTSREWYKRLICILCGLFVFGSCFTIWHLAYFGNRLQKYTDIVMEWTSAVQSNKSAEMHLVYLLVFAGLVCILVTFLYYRRRNTFVLDMQSAVQKTLKPEQAVVLYAAVTLLVVFFVYGYFNPIIICALGVGFLYYVLDRRHFLHGLVFYFFSMYAVVALFRLLVVLGRKTMPSIAFFIVI